MEELGKKYMTEKERNAMARKLSKLQDLDNVLKLVSKKTKLKAALHALFTKKQIPECIPTNKVS